MLGSASRTRGAYRLPCASLAPASWGASGFRQRHANSSLWGRPGAGAWGHQFGVAAPNAL